MYPLEMSFDKFKIGFVDIENKDLSLFEKKFVDLDYSGRPRMLKNQYYLLSSTDEYILKLNRDRSIDDEELHQMVVDLCKRQFITNSVDFPIGYVKEGDNVVGQIIRYYSNAKSFKTICLTEDLEDLQKYIYLDDDSLHNLFLVYLNILEQIEQLFESGISYLDVHPGNIVFYKNLIKIIDFEPNYISFLKLKCNYKQLIFNYIRMINEVLEQFFLEGKISLTEENSSFNDVKKKVINLENTARRFI